MPPRVYVGSVYGRNIEPDHLTALLRLLRHPTVRFAPTYNDAMLCRARSTTATRFLLETEDDVHISIDGDIIFRDADALQIAEQAVRYGLVGGLYVTRARRGGQCRPTSVLLDDQPIEFSSDPTPRPVKWLATGFLATSRRVFELLARDLPLLHASETWRFYPFYQPFWIDGPKDTIYLSEDFALVERARRAGFQPYVNPAVRLYHLGLHPFGLEDMTVPEPPMTSVRITRTPDGRHKIETPDR